MPDEPMIIGIPIYQDVDLLDICAPCEIFSWMSEAWQKQPGGRAANVFLVAITKDHVRTRDGAEIVPHKTFAELPKLDLLFVPGGGLKGLVDAGNDAAYIDFLKTRSVDANYVTSVCEGALLLARAGLLNGFHATTHWAFKNCLSQFDEINVADGYPSYVVDRNRVTGGGISSGLEECMKLVEILAGPEIAKGVRRTIQYYPQFVENDLPEPPPAWQHERRLAVEQSTCGLLSRGQRFFSTFNDSNLIGGGDWQPIGPSPHWLRHVPWSTEIPNPSLPQRSSEQSCRRWSHQLRCLSG